MQFPLPENISPQEAFGEALAKFGGRHKNVAVLDTDFASETKTGKFEKLYPDRHFTFGHAESNVVTTAAGMAIRGKIPFVCSYGIFVPGKAWEYVRNSICYPNLNVKMVGSHAGVLTGQDGAIHQALEDIAITRAIPNMKIICPADAIETYLAVEEIMKDFGPTYLRLGQKGGKFVYDKDHTFKIGFGDILTFGADICFIATGTMVSVCLEVAKKLEQENIHVMVVNISTIKPIDKKLIIDCAQKTKMVVTAEDHNIIGGLGSAVTEVLSENYPTKVHRIGMDRFGESGKPEDLYKKYGLDFEGVYAQVLGWWQAMEK